jgi:trehalose-6-phosphate synthase
MSVTKRLLAATWIFVLVMMAVFTVVHVRYERQRLVSDLARRAVLVGEGVKEAVEPSVRRASTAATTRVVRRLAQPNRKIVVFDQLGGAITAAPPEAADELRTLGAVTDAIATGTVQEGLHKVAGRLSYVYVTPLRAEDERIVGAVAAVLDGSAINAAVADAWRFNAIRYVIVAVGVSIIIFVIVRLTVTRPLAAMAGWTKALKSGHAMPPPHVADTKLFEPLAVEVVGLARRLRHAEAAAEREAALRLTGEAIWTEQRLKQFARALFDGQALFVVSNREPLSHVRENGRIVAHTPASGVVTAIEPVMRACGGVWLAHGSGSADWETVDADGRLGVPEDDPRYTLRRIRLTPEEESGYYYGFSNEGLWPLCHVVHARPSFRPTDWAHYRAVNEKFAAALLKELDGVDTPMVLIQDYHFALLPALVKAERPDARVAIFWHIPWPNAEAFAICPWQREILTGMLGADLIGFHTQYHCNNFLDTVDRTVEARIDAEHFAVVRGERRTLVKPFPISVAPDLLDEPPKVTRRELLEQLGVQADFIGVGIDRVDYTKGLLERFDALRRFFELYPEYRERLVFVQVAAPSRSSIARYQELQHDVQARVAEMNRTLGTRSWRPILYLERHHDRAEIWPLYRHADFCMVTSLHDGMNLVAKEYVSARDDGGGALILSEFTGAARELRDALLVNPYDTDATADAVRSALEMPGEERALRMRRMNRLVREQNIYRWAGQLLGELSRIPDPRPTSASV